MSSLQWADLFGDAFDDGVMRLVTTIRRILGPADASQADTGPRSRDEDLRDHCRAAGPGQSEGFALTGPQGQDQSTAGQAFTGSWHYTSDGFEATPLMNMANTAMPGHPGMHDQSPYIRIGVCVACEPISQDTGSSRIGSGFVRFLSRDPVASLTSALTGVGGDMSWVRLAGHGVIRLEATLGDTGEAGKPAASAMLLPPVAGMQMHGRPGGVACLWLHLEPRGPDGTAARPASLAVWHRRLRHAISLAAGFAEFLAGDLGLVTHDDPAARVGVLLNAANSMTELVDTGLLHALPGAIPSRQFLGYAIADRAGKPASEIARTTLAQLCEYTLHLDDFEPVLAAL